MVVGIIGQEESNGNVQELGNNKPFMIVCGRILENLWEEGFILAHSSRTHSPPR